MAVEIEKPSVSFTNEAQRALQHSLLRVERKIRARAADKAIKSRGTPSEVTGSDIEKAYREVIGRNTPNFSTDRMGDQILRKDRRLQLMARFCIVLGLSSTVLAAIYPFIRNQLQNPSLRFSVILAVGGLFMAGIGLLVRVFALYLGISRINRDYFMSHLDDIEREVEMLSQISEDALRRFHENPKEPD